MYIAEIHWKLD